MIESRRAPSEIETLRRPTDASLRRAVAHILDRIERGQDVPNAALCMALCPKAACRRTRRCDAFGAHGRRPISMEPAIRMTRPSHRSPGTL